VTQNWGFEALLTGKLVIKGFSKLLVPTAGIAFGADMCYGSITQWTPSAEYGRLLREEINHEEFKAGFKDSYTRHFSSKPK
jgi:hypothetical protein